MRRFVRDMKGAVTVFVSLLLVPAILVTGTAVDLTTIYAARSYVKNANQLAANAMLANYDELLRDLYALYAITENEAEIQSVLTKYLQLTLFGDENQNSGKVIHTTVGAATSMVTVADANLYNREILRRQIEEYVKFRAPEFFIEKVLDNIEKFTKFIPDIKAIITKISLEIELAFLYDLEEQLYYSMRYHDLYVHDLSLENGTVNEYTVFENPTGMEYRLSEEIDEELEALSGFADTLQDKKDDYATKKSAYDNATQRFLETDSEFQARLQMLKIAMDMARAAFENAKADALSEITRIEGIADGKSADILQDVAAGGSKSLVSYIQDQENAEDAVLAKLSIVGVALNTIKDVTDFLNPLKLACKGAMAVRKDSISGQHVYDSMYNKTPKDYLDNIVEMEQLVENITFQEKAIVSYIAVLENQLPDCSEALRGSENIPGMGAEVQKIKNSIGETETLCNQYNSVKSGIADKTNGYFKRLGNYMSASNITLESTTVKSFSELRSAMNIPIEGANPAGFEDIREKTIKTVPYYEKAAEDGQAFNYFSEDQAVCLRYGRLYQKFGDNSYWSNLGNKIENTAKSFGQAFSGAWEELTAGISTDADGEDMPPAVYNFFKTRAAAGENTLYEQAITKLSQAGLNPGDSSLTILITVVDMLHAATAVFVDLPNMFLPDAILDKTLLLTYDANMFSNYTTQEDGETYTGYKYSKNVNYMLGDEQEYLIVGSNLELVNQCAVAALLLVTRFWFNYLSSFIVPTVNEICLSADGFFLAGEVLRIVFSLAESLFDVYKLRGGDSVAIIKFMDSQWKTMPAGIIHSTFNTTMKNLIKKTLEVLAEEIRDTALNVGMEIALTGLISGQSDTLLNGLKEIEGSDVYSNAQLVEIVVLTAKQKGFSKTMTEAIENAVDGFTDTFDMKPDIEGKKPEDFLSTLTDSDNREKLEKLKNGTSDGEFFNEEMKEKIGENLAESLADAITPSMNYSDYCAVFMFMQSPDTLANRTADLIALNLGNYKKNGNSSDEHLVIGVDDVYDMTKARTAFGVQTEYDLSLLFLSMPLAQNGIKGVVPPKSIALSQTDYRGY